MIGIKANRNYEKYEWKRIVIFKKSFIPKRKISRKFKLWMKTLENTHHINLAIA